MSRNRVSPSAGYVAQSKLPKGPNGRNLCRQCVTEVTPPRLTFCSDECVDAWKVKTSPAHVRRKLLKRDRGVCALCGLDCVAAERELRKLRADGYRAYAGSLSSKPLWEMSDDYAAQAYVNGWDRLCHVEFRAFFIRCLEIGLSKPWTGCSIWEADHVTPVVEGGGECGLEGFRTLCVPCHRLETAKLARRRADKRKLDAAQRQALRDPAMVEVLRELAKR